MTFAFAPLIPLIGDLVDIVAPTIAGVGLIRAITQIIRKQRAEGRLSSLLTKDKEHLLELEEMKPRLMASSLDTETIDEANKLLGTLVAQLGKEDQKQLMEGLSQSSEKSRVNYMVKLVTESERESEEGE